MPRGDTVMVQDQQRFDLLVYGTLCVPAVLVRVLGRKCEDLEFQDAILPGYTRHCVKGEDYPAIINRESTSKILPPDMTLKPEEYSTRGTLVSGLTYRDVHSLDVFEGTEYTRRKVTIQTLSPSSDLHDLPPKLAHPESREPLDNLRAEERIKQSTLGDQDLGSRECWAYLWSADLNRLEPTIWDLQTFIKDKASFWTSTNTTEYDEVDQYRALQASPDARGTV